MSSRGGGNTQSTQQSYDPAYNARMADLAERQQALADEYFAYWEDVNAPYERELVQANQGLIPAQTALERQQIDARGRLLPAQTDLTLEQIEAMRGRLPAENALALETIGANREILPHQTTHTIADLQARTSLIPQQTELTSAQIGEQMAGIKQRAPVQEKFYSEALNGADASKMVGEARTDVAQAYKASGDTLKRDMARYGVSPASGRFASNMSQHARDRAKSMAGASSTARKNARDESWNRLTTAMGGR